VRCTAIRRGRGIRNGRSCLSIAATGWYRLQPYLARSQSQVGIWQPCRPFSAKDLPEKSWSKTAEVLHQQISTSVGSVFVMKLESTNSNCPVWVGEFANECLECLALAGRNSRELGHRKQSRQLACSRSSHRNTRHNTGLRHELAVSCKLSSGHHSAGRERQKGDESEGLTVGRSGHAAIKVSQSRSFGCRRAIARNTGVTSRSHPVQSTEVDRVQLPRMRPVDQPMLHSARQHGAVGPVPGRWSALIGQPPAQPR
jgi:hypothetical protein